MRCWKCKQDMPEGLKYCGNCGVHMNRAVHFFQWLFSRKGLPVLLILAALVLGSAAWAILAQAGDTAPDASHIDFEAILRQEAFPEGDPLREEMNAAVEIRDLTVSGEAIRFTMAAPNIAPELIAWYEARDDFSDAELEHQILALLAGEKHEAEYILTYTVDIDGIVTIHYTESYLSAIGCGIRQFYDYLYDQILGGAKNG